MRLVSANLPRVCRYLAVLCLLAPSLAGLAVHGHHQLADHHELAHHVEALEAADHAHAHGLLGHHHAGEHAHRSIGPRLSAECRMGQDPPHHHVFEPIADVGLLRTPGPTGSPLSPLPLLGIRSAAEVLEREQTQCPEGELRGVGPPARHGSLAVLNCSLLI